MKFQNWILSWSPPENCTAILGPLNVAKIEIKGINGAVKNFNVTKNTQNSEIDLQEILYGAEQYVAKIFALRNFDGEINISAYEEHKFETPSKGKA